MKKDDRVKWVKTRKQGRNIKMNTVEGVIKSIDKDHAIVKVSSNGRKEVVPVDELVYESEPSPLTSFVHELARAYEKKANQERKS